MKPIISSAIYSLLGLFVISYLSAYAYNTVVGDLGLLELIGMPTVFSFIFSIVIAPIVLHRMRRSPANVVDGGRSNTVLGVVMIPVGILVLLSGALGTFGCAFSSGGIVCDLIAIFVPTILGIYLLSLFLPRKIKAYSILFKLLALIGAIIWLGIILIGQ